jgi:hypothetical protein
MIHINKIDTVKNLLFSLYKKNLIMFWGLLSNSENCLLYERKLLELLFVQASKHKYRLILDIRDFSSSKCLQVVTYKLHLNKWEKFQSNSAVYYKQEVSTIFIF